MDYPMSASALVFPGKFTKREESWPRINLNYIAPITDALFDWAADQLPIGDINRWASLTNGALMLADGGASKVVDSGGRRAVRTNGTTNRLRALTPGITGAHTVVAVFRMLSPAVGDAVFLDYAGQGAGTVSVSSSNTLLAYAPSSTLSPNPPVTPDTNWHVSILTVNGTDSAFRVDSKEGAGPLNNSARQGITLGFGSGGDMRSEIEYARVAVIGRAYTATERASLYAKLAAEYAL